MSFVLYFPFKSKGNTNYSSIGRNEHWYVGMYMMMTDGGDDDDDG